MRSFIVVLILPPVDYPFCFLDRVEQPVVQTTVSEDTVKTFIMPILPGTTRIDIPGFDPGLLEPVLDLPGNKLWTIITLYAGRGAPLSEQSLEHLLYMA